MEISGFGLSSGRILKESGKCSSGTVFFKMGFIPPSLDLQEWACELQTHRDRDVDTGDAVSSCATPDRLVTLLSIPPLQWGSGSQIYQSGWNHSMTKGM